jgi:hypothetical protein
VWTSNQQPRRLVLEGTEIRGIVTLSDIQKLPVRIALFSLFIHFELLLTEHLREEMSFLIKAGTSKAFGLEVPLMLLARADEMIDRVESCLLRLLTAACGPSRRKLMSARMSAGRG